MKFNIGISEGIHSRIFDMVQSYYKKKYKKKYQKKRASYARRRAPVRRSSYRRRTRRSRVGGSMGPSRMMPKYIKALVNPFQKDVYGVRIPDTSTSPSSSLMLYDELTISADHTNPTWARAQLFVPNSSQYSYITVPAAANSWTIPAAFGGATATNKQIAVQSNFDLVRPVAHALRITCQQAATGAAGYCHIALVDLDTFGTTWQNLPQDIGGMASNLTYRRVTLASLTQNPLVVVNRYMDQTAFSYVSCKNKEIGSFNQSMPFMNAFHSWMGILVVFEGMGVAADAVIASVENICHFEVTSQPSGVNPDHPAEMSNPEVLDAAANCQSHSNCSFIEGTTDETMYLQSAYAYAGIHTGANYGYNGGIPGVNNPGRLANSSV